LEIRNCFPYYFPISSSIFDEREKKLSQSDKTTLIIPDYSELTAQIFTKRVYIAPEVIVDSKIWWDPQENHPQSTHGHRPLKLRTLGLHQSLTQMTMQAPLL
jgi:hypothetical protein